MIQYRIPKHNKKEWTLADDSKDWNRKGPENTDAEIAADHFFYCRDGWESSGRGPLKIEVKVNNKIRLFSVRIELRPEFYARCIKV